VGNADVHSSLRCNENCSNESVTSRYGLKRLDTKETFNCTNGICLINMVNSHLSLKKMEKESAASKNLKVCCQYLESK